MLPITFTSTTSRLFPSSCVFKHTGRMEQVGSGRALPACSAQPASLNAARWEQVGDNGAQDEDDVEARGGDTLRTLCCHPLPNGQGGGGRCGGSSGSSGEVHTH